ncbi:HD domain-containing protein [Tistrella sp. BH-R2-4]|uniref:HD domain-containing protein n=1 Tax=Tistrella arctica TaxID=3133430 RepID=A0ABU9YEM3_9PROT
MSGRQITIWDFGVETVEAPHVPPAVDAFDDLADWAPVSWPDAGTTAGDLFPEAPRFRFRLDDAAIAAAFPHSLHRDLIASAGFQRLRDVSFLGVIDRLFHPNGRPSFVRHNRFHHSLGVALLAVSYCRMAAVAPRDREILIAAALLHDVGHGPLSHTLEPVFADRFGIDHHAATASIIRGEVPLGLDIRAALDRHGIDPDEVVGLIARRSSRPHAHLFSGPINIDTIDGICRANTYLHRAPVDAHPLISVLALARVDRAGVRRLDGFWRLKEQIYETFIYGDVCRSADALVQRHVDQTIDRYRPEDFFLSERALLGRARDLQTLITILVGHIHADFRAAHAAAAAGRRRGAPAPAPAIETVMGRERRFTIEPDVVLDSPEAYARRYREIKARRRRPLYGLSALAAIAGDGGGRRQHDLFAAA